MNDICTLNVTHLQYSNGTTDWNSPYTTTSNDDYSEVKPTGHRYLYTLQNEILLFLGETPLRTRLKIRHESGGIQPHRPANVSNHFN
jgi:hypothetical protein